VQDDSQTEAVLAALHVVTEVSAWLLFDVLALIPQGLSSFPGHQDGQHADADAAGAELHAALTQSSQASR
jgi:hypothetical protein